MDLKEVKEVLDLVTAVVLPLTGIVLSLYGWRKTGQIDLDKTWGHAEDVIHVVHEAIEKDGSDPNKEIERGVDEIEKIRKKTLSKKMRGKAAARIKSLLMDRIKGLTRDRIKGLLDKSDD